MLRFCLFCRLPVFGVIDLCIACSRLIGSNYYSAYSNLADITGFLVDNREVEIAQIHPAKNFENLESESPDQLQSTRSSPNWAVILGILVGDCFHNIVDGIAVGVAWSQSPGSGIGTTIAIAMHELPHELGDFIVYKKLGLRTRQAIGLNLFAALLSFGGLYTGLGLASNPAVTSWLLALVAGLFIYISMVDVVC